MNRIRLVGALGIAAVVGALGLWGAMSGSAPREAGSDARATTAASSMAATQAARETAGPGAGPGGEPSRAPDAADSAPAPGDLALTPVSDGVSTSSTPTGAQDAPGGMVRYGMLNSKVRGLDPMDVGDTTSSGVASNFYESLYQYHYLKRPYVPVPCLAADMPTYSADRLTLTIPLRKDVFFHDSPCFPGGKGRQLVADDFIFAWKRIAFVKNISKNWWLLEDLIVGLDEYREATKGIAKAAMDYSQAVEGLQAPDPHTLVIKLKKPAPDFIYRLCHLPTAPMAREAVKHFGDEIINAAVGTGPFVLVDFNRNAKVVMRRNPTFREELYPSEGEPGDKEAGLLADAGKRLPFIDRAEFTVIEEDQPYWLTFMRGDSDLAGIPKDNFGQAIGSSFELKPELAQRGIVLERFAEPTTNWVGFNMDDPVVGKNLPLRQAISLAYDRKKSIQLFTNNRNSAARGPLPPSLGDYNPALDSPYTKLDLKLAKQKVEEARALHQRLTGERSLPQLQYVIGGTDATAVQMGQFFVRCMKAVGIEVKLETTDWPSAQDMIHNKKAQLFTLGWVMDWPDPLNMMLLWYGPYESPGANSTNYKNPAYDQLFQKAITMEDGPQRTALVRQMEQMVVNDLPNVFIDHRQSFVLLHPWVRNNKSNVFGYGLMKYARIDTAMRAKMKGR